MRASRELIARRSWLMVALLTLAVTGSILGTVGRKLVGGPFAVQFAFAVVPVLLCAWVSRRAIRASASRRLNTADYWLGLALAWSCFGLAYNLDAESAAYSAYSIVLVVSMYWFSRAIGLRSVKTGLAFCAGVMLCNAIFFASLWNPNQIALQLVCVVAIGVFLARSRFRQVLIAAVMAILLVRFQSRTAVFGAVLALGVTVMFLRRPNIGHFLIAGAAAIAVVLAFSIDLDALQDAALDEVARSQNSVLQFVSKGKETRFLDDPFNRRAHWESALAGIAESPWFGYGMANESEAMGKDRAHNAFMTSAIRIGIPGAFFFLMFYLLHLVRIWRSFLRRPSRYHVLAFYLVTYLFISGFAESSGLFSLGTSAAILAIFLVFYTDALDMTTAAATALRLNGVRAKEVVRAGAPVRARGFGGHPEA